MNRLALSHTFSLLFKPTTRSNWDLLTPLALIGLGLFGVAFIYSAQFSVPHGSTSSLLRQEWFKQIVYLSAGAAVYVGVSLIDYRFWLSIAHWFYAACLIPLLVVLIPGVGGAVAEKWGASRWIPLGPFGTYQPSETAKIAVLLITATVLVHSKIGTVRQSLGTLGKLALAVGAPLFLILLQPDLKSAIVLPPMVFSMLYVSKLSPRFFVAALGAFLVIVGLVAWDCVRYMKFMDAHGYDYVKTGRFEKEGNGIVPFHDYQRNRILAYIAPDKVDPKGIGVTYNLQQSLISVGSGGLVGKGWTEGTQAQLGYLPRSVAHNDFIFSVIAEEKGFLGSLTVLGLFGLVLFNGIRIAGSARDRFGTLLAIGVTVLFTVHVFVNIAMTIGLVPITGIPLPFISYGGSFVLSCCLLQGLVQSVWRFRKDFT
ncbi:FtsW/RodA/SpoVE family cell cycle protein [Horticoccus sp. 23ND18S-11]|uniref:FtsW/RodA/SpoVE family cell cycle protein n=1 Tax=Horticoccus sp. 23ND18S-11 TaxID=3391832 RepID=UPI0039C92651